MNVCGLSFGIKQNVKTTKNNKIRIMKRIKNKNKNNNNNNSNNEKSNNNINSNNNNNDNNKITNLLYKSSRHSGCVTS